MRIQISETFKSIFICLLSFQLMACGTILYPERKGQKDGRLDMGVVLLDAIGLLFFLIPGVIAFAVDFNNGTIYLPDTAKADDAERYRTVHFNPDHYTLEELEEIIREETGSDFKFNDERLGMTQLENRDEISTRFARYADVKQMQVSQLAF